MSEDDREFVFVCALVFVVAVIAALVMAVTLRPAEREKRPNTGRGGALQVKPDKGIELIERE